LIYEGGKKKKVMHRGKDNIKLSRVFPLTVDKRMGNISMIREGNHRYSFTNVDTSQLFPKEQRSS
jgi:hypothetical protein